MKRDDLLWWLLGGALVAYLLYNRQGVTGVVQSVGESVSAAVSGWANVNQGPVWVPVINQTEDALGIPVNLLARQAYQESHFRQEIIDGTYVDPTTGKQGSSAGALGILQLMPYFGSAPGFASVRVPIPFSTADTQAQITEAGNEMVRLYNHYQDWGLALAAYNDGEGNVDKYLAGTRSLPQQTQDYVTQILADVPVQSSMVVA